MKEDGIFNIFREFDEIFADLPQDEGCSIHPEFLDKLDSLSDLFKKGQNQEIRERSPEFVDANANSACVKAEMLDLYKKIYDEVESKKLAKPHTLTRMNKLIERLEKSISESESITGSPLEQRDVNWRELMQERMRSSTKQK